MQRYWYSLATALGVWLVLWLLLVGTPFLWQPTLDIQMHTTYFVVGSYLGQLSTFLFVLIFVLLLDAVRRQAAKNSTAALACGIGSFLLLSWSIKLNTAYFTPWATQDILTPVAYPNALVKIMWATQVLLLIAVIWSGVTLWRFRSTRSH
ncbi:hypothetical protein DNI29_01730 [Hymenobacter sediminis]|uniref:hypothetical protein n=1 Tax=Hymenobacter sediminis TaxID=2218621 RepID=UPI000DA6A154|nr:hypothetical protein [Hymenobacter sediminis]RPD49545.1 hypothetical protein DNI29_01730 [Hymenobacter sediminis]